MVFGCSSHKKPIDECTIKAQQTDFIQYNRYESSVVLYLSTFWTGLAFTQIVENMKAKIVTTRYQLMATSL